jgi:hypothetical protein
MKPRLGPAELTEEDLEIAKRNSLRWWKLMGYVRPCLAPIYVIGDRADAYLMFRCQRSRSYTFPVDLPAIGFIGSIGWIDCGGALAQWKTLNITHFA